MPRSELVCDTIGMTDSHRDRVGRRPTSLEHRLERSLCPRALLKAGTAEGENPGESPLQSHVAGDGAVGGAAVRPVSATQRTTRVPSTPLRSANFRAFAARSVAVGAICAWTLPTRLHDRAPQRDTRRDERTDVGA